MNDSTTGKTIYWHDYETFGSDPRRDRACQFAGLRTDEDLNIIGEPLVIYCRPSGDRLPAPEACLITGITPQKAEEAGLCEAEFIARISEEFSRPGTCVAGYNSLRFDDEVTRQILYRNFYDPYEREWKNGNSRWDIIDMLRLCRALRPEGIRWPDKEDGLPDFRLEKLSAANGIAHVDAHDALADVMATIEMARLIRDRQPRLYHYLYRLRAKQRVNEALALPEASIGRPLLHVSAMYPASRACLAVVAPLRRHPVDRNGVLVYDLRVDPRQWLELSPEQVRQRLFKPKAELEAAGLERIPLKTLHLNRCPAVAPLSVLAPERARELDVDLERCQRHWELLAGASGLQSLLGEVFSAGGGFSESDPDYMLYSGGFFGDADRQAMRQIRSARPDQLADLTLRFQDARLEEMLFRYRCRNYPQHLSPEEVIRWRQFCRERLFDPEGPEGQPAPDNSTRPGKGRRADLSLAEFTRRVRELRAERQSDADQEILAALESYARRLLQEHMEHMERIERPAAQASTASVSETDSASYRDQSHSKGRSLP